MITANTRPSRDTVVVFVYIKNLNLKLKNIVFKRNDPIKIFDFLTRFVNETDRLNISEVHSFIALPNFLAD